MKHDDTTSELLPERSQHSKVSNPHWWRYFLALGQSIDVSSDVTSWNCLDVVYDDVTCVCVCMYIYTSSHSAMILETGKSQQAGGTHPQPWVWKWNLSSLFFCGPDWAMWQNPRTPCPDPADRQHNININDVFKLFIHLSTGYTVYLCRVPGKLFIFNDLIGELKSLVS